MLSLSSSPQPPSIARHLSKRPHSRSGIRFFFAGLLAIALASADISWLDHASNKLAKAQDPEGIYDNEPSQEPRQTPDEAAKGFKLPEGFNVCVFAAEPDVQQPIALCTDQRGRLWVAENYTYADAATNFDTKLKDRIVILEDTNGDGTHDSRKVFWDQASKLTSIEVGFGGVWVLATPNLLFIPDKNGDDKPDSAPQILLDGFQEDRVRHNFVNGLKWGPDGWLYARHGIQAASQVGKPGAIADQRTTIECCIWRYHPTKHEFDVVCRGTTNPWGMDWNDLGEPFFINTVIGHLWHAIPGARLQRMYGEDADGHTYQLMQHVADHVHWNIAAEAWSDIRAKGITPETDKAGGGHAHSGLMFYLGGNWPAEYRDELFTLNFHGRRFNQEHVEPRGAGFIGLHRPDFAQASDPWYRGIDLIYGPDGGVFVADWSDAGECHENDGVHRRSGRIFKITYQSPLSVQRLDVSRMSEGELLQCLYRTNDWFVRHARLEMAQRTAAGKISDALFVKLRERLLDANEAPRIRLRALWALKSCNRATNEDLLSLLGDANENIRSWGVRLLVDRYNEEAPIVEALAKCAAQEKSPLVRLYLASALQKCAGDAWWQIAGSLVASSDLADDRDFPLLLWYGISSKIGTQPNKGVELLAQCKIPLLQRFIARRVGSEIDTQAESVNALIAYAAQQSDPAVLKSITEGLFDSMAGRGEASVPAAWQDLVAKIESTGDDSTKQTIKQLSAVFGDGRAVEELMALVSNREANIDWRRQAIASLARKKSEGLIDALKPILDERDLAASAIDGIALVGADDDAKMLVERFNGFYPPAKEAIIRMLASRPNYALLLVNGVREGKVNRAMISAGMLRQMQLLGDETLNTQLSEVFQDVRLYSQDKLQRLAKYRDLLQEEKLAAGNPNKGRLIYEQACSKCHKLYGEGGTIGPELTGAQRANLNYLLDNVVDPSAQVADSFRISVVRLNDGRVRTGVASPPSSGSIVLQTTEEKITLRETDVEEIKLSGTSLMPDGLLDPLSDEQVIDLVSYLRTASQVEKAAPPAPSETPVK